MAHRLNFRLLLAAALLSGGVFLFAEDDLTKTDSGAATTNSRLIAKLDSRDPAFVRYQKDVENGRKLIFSGKAAEAAEKLVFYRYAPQEGDELLALAARCSVSYDTISTLNHLDRESDILKEDFLLLPSSPGLFLPEEPASDFERLLLASRDEEERERGILVSVDRNGKEETLRFFPGAFFSGTERAFFVGAGEFRFPLKSFRLTSSFGNRVSPIDGKLRPHGGLDLAAPVNTEVLASKTGLVTETGFSPVYGNYITVTHDKGWSSFYGHLSAILVKKGDNVRSGAAIGRVGTTGLTTGPHLHFELRRNGKAEDPAPRLRKDRQGGS